MGHPCPITDSGVLAKVVLPVLAEGCGMACFRVKYLSADTVPLAIELLCNFWIVVSQHRLPNPLLQLIHQSLRLCK